MPSDAAALASVREALPGIAWRRMMGEYLLYKDGILFGGIYDDRLLLKITKASSTILADCPSAFPYEGGGEMILFPEPYDAALLRRAVDAMCEEIVASRRSARKSRRTCSPLALGGSANNYDACTITPAEYG